MIIFFCENSRDSRNTRYASYQSRLLKDHKTVIFPYARLPLDVDKKKRSLTEPLGDLAVVHLRVFLGDLLPLGPRPNHERVHGPLDVIALLLNPLGARARHSHGGRHALLHAPQGVLEARRRVVHAAAGSVKSP